MSSTITLDNTDDEVIVLDVSQDAIADDACEENSDCSSSHRKENVFLGDVEKARDSEDPNGIGGQEEPLTDPLVPRSKSPAAPLFKVIFRDEAASRQYRKRIKDFLEELIACKDERTSEEKESGNLLLEIWESVNDSVDIVTESDESQDIICDSLFVVDTKPKLKDDLDVPTYGKKYDNVYEKPQPGMPAKEEAPSARRIPMMCFNCSGDHNLKDCTQPRDHIAINKNRKNFNAKGSGKALRYHLEGDQKFGHMVPGQLSHNLRRALGLRDNELPRHIYRMRILGYPPGWLEEARLQHSGLSLFNSEGVAERETSESSVGGPSPPDADQYDLKKIFDFPGFNVPPPPGIKDDYRNQWPPELQALHSKQMMLNMLNGREAEEGYKRKKMKVTLNAIPAEDSKTVPKEMEIVDVDDSVVECVPVNGLFVPPLPPVRLDSQPTPPPPPADPASLPIAAETSPLAPAPAPVPPPPPPPATPASQESDCPSQELATIESPVLLENRFLRSNSTPRSRGQPFNKLSSCQPATDRRTRESLLPIFQEDSASPFSRANSPSLSDLENMKKRLLVELEDETSSQSNPETPVRNSSLNSSVKLDMPPPMENSTPELNRSQSRNTHNTSHGSVLSVDFGTPVLQSTSPFNRLPSSEKFSKDICDVINYENLPDSTGKYEQMTKVLQKVRDTLGKLQRE